MPGPDGFIHNSSQSFDLFINAFDKWCPQGRPYYDEDSITFSWFAYVYVIYFGQYVEKRMPINVCRAYTRMGQLATTYYNWVEKYEKKAEFPQGTPLADLAVHSFMHTMAGVDQASKVSI